MASSTGAHQEDQQLSPSTAALAISDSDITESARCECCGLTEECTPAYSEQVREQYGGRWICGLCGEAVKDEICRLGKSTEEAVERHMKVCQQFRLSSPPVNATGDLISAVKHLLRRILDSPRKKKGSVFPSSP